MKGLNRSTDVWRRSVLGWARKTTILLNLLDVELRANTKVWALGQRLEFDKVALGATDWLEVEK